MTATQDVAASVPSGTGAAAFDLQELIDRQRELQITAYEGDPALFRDDAKIAYLRWNFLALLDETHEALGEIGWKPWASSRHINRDALTGELVDALHFFANICLATGIDATALRDGYLAKNARNAQRQVDGYDGVSSKCPNCRRELDGPGSLRSDEESRWFECAGCGASIDDDILSKVLDRLESPVLPARRPYQFRVRFIPIDVETQVERYARAVNARQKIVEWATKPTNAFRLHHRDLENAGYLYEAQRGHELTISISYQTATGDGDAHDITRALHRELAPYSPYDIEQRKPL